MRSFKYALIDFFKAVSLTLTDTVKPIEVEMANTATYLLMQHIQSTISIHLESCFWPLHKLV